MTRVFLALYYFLMPIHLFLSILLKQVEEAQVVKNWKYNEILSFTYNLQVKKERLIPMAICD
jgi:hypothetical protein